MPVKHAPLCDTIISDLVLLAKTSRCHRSKCASIILTSEFKSSVLGIGINSMPNGCSGPCFKDELASGFKSDRTCCVHAEQRAIMDMLANCRQYQYQNNHTYLYFLRLDDDGNPKPSGQPYCSICSKMALDVGITYFCLWHGPHEGWIAYETKEYNDLTFQYGK